MPVVVIGKTEVAARLLRYTEKEKAGQVEPRVLHAEGVRCRVPTAMEEFAALRELHGKQGATRRAKARYELPDRDLGEEAVYVRKRRPSGRKYWAVAKDGEVATHVRREAGQVVRENEAVHLITSFGVDEVNPDDPEQVRAAFEYTVAMMRGLYPGAQMKLVGQADGKGMTDSDGNFLTEGGKFHVHTVLNAVVAERMELDGQVWEPGRKLSGALTDISRIRQRADEFNAAHHDEFGLPKQRLASVEDQRRERRGVRDRRMAAEGKRSNHDLIRDAYESAMDDPRSVDLDGFATVLAERGVEITVRGSKRPALSYRLPDAMKTNVRGTTLGDHYAYAETVEQLAANAAGQPRRRRPVPVAEPMPRSATPVSADEIEQARELMARLAREEQLDSWIDDWAAEQHRTADELLTEMGLDPASRADRERLRPAMGKWLSEKSDEPTSSASATDVPAPESAPLPRDAKKPDPFADLYAELDANTERELAALKAELGIGKTLAEIDAEKAAEAAVAASEPVEASEVPVSAPEPVEGEESASPDAVSDEPATAAPASAELPKATKEPYRSRLRKLRGTTPKAQERIEQLAAYEEVAVPVLEARGRLDEATLTAIGVGPAVLEKLGPVMHPAFRGQLELRAHKAARAKSLYEGGNRTAAKRLRDEISNGVFEHVSTGRKPVVGPEAEEEQAGDDGLSR